MSEQEVIIEKQVDMRTATLKLRNDGILEYVMKSSDDFTVEDIKETNKAVGELGGGRAFLNLVYIHQLFNTDPEVREYAATEESNRYTIADAFVVNSTALKLVGNFYIRFNKPARPTKIFTSDTEAIEWLKSFL